MRLLRTIILAAGKGTRMKSQTPKVLHHVCGRPLIDYVLDIAGAVGSLKICVVLGHQIEKVQEHLSSDIEIVLQAQLLGTADAVRCAQKFFTDYDGDILLLCGDTPLLRRETVRNLIRRHRKTKADVTFLTAVVEDSRGYGRVIRDENGRALAIREENDATGVEKTIKEINVGVYCFRSRALFTALTKVKKNSRKGEFYLTDVIEILTAEGRRVETAATPDAAEGRGVNTRVDLAVCHAMIRQRILEDVMLSGVTIVDPSTTHIDADVKIGQDTIIRPFTVIEHDVRVGGHCVIGPFARLRPGTRIKNFVEIGNFVEISRTVIGEKTLMKHFGFLGDARVGSAVNIGAGTVTANFDGHTKSETTILDGAFIGSDSVLVAPVTVGKKAMTGAGSVVTRGQVIPDGQVVVGVPARILQKKNDK